MMAAICKNFHTSTNNIQTRVTKMFSDALRSDRAPLVSYYGAIAGLQELGPEVIKVFILPHISSLAHKIDIGRRAVRLIFNDNKYSRGVGGFFYIYIFLILP
jgi:hypothetical protein